MRRRWRFFTTSTWWLGFQTERSYCAPYEWRTDVFVIPGVGISFMWGWHCEDCTRRYERRWLLWFSERRIFYP